MDLSEMTAQLNAYCAEVEKFRRDANVDVAEEKVGREVNEWRARFNFHDGNVAAAEAAVEIDRIARTHYDQGLRDRDFALVQAERELYGVFRKAIEDAAEVGEDPALENPRDDHTRMLAEMLRNQRRDSAGRQVDGKTAAQLGRGYSKTPDRENPEYIKLIEQVVRGSADVVLRPDPSDAEALIALRRLIAERRAQRIRERAPEALAALEKLEKVSRSAVLDALRRHVRSGRGIAVRPKQRSVTVRAVSV